MIRNKILCISTFLLGSIMVACSDSDSVLADEYEPEPEEEVEDEDPEEVEDEDPVEESVVVQLDYGELLAFPGAEGHGRNVTGGRGGKVYHVTSLSDDGSEGTLRYALKQKGARTIVFDVCGTIQLNEIMKTNNDSLTIAGQTSPGGICIAGYPFSINSNNVILRFLRFRMDDTVDGDALGGMDKANVIVDHCSASWSTDECLSVYAMDHSTVQWCMAYQALRVTNAKGGDSSHGFGGNWGGHYASYHHNIIAHCESRVPRLGPRYSTLGMDGGSLPSGEMVDFRNNVYYNWNGSGCYGGEAQNANIVNNYYKPGPATNMNKNIAYRIAKPYVYPSSYSSKSFEPWFLTWGTFYITGNYVYGNEEVSNDNWTKGVWEQMSMSSSDEGVAGTVWDNRTSIKSDAMIVGAGSVTTQSATAAYEKVLDLSGACDYRDVIDKMILSDISNGTASCTADGNDSGYINNPTDVLSALPELGGDPFSACALNADSSRSITDTDGDGIPDEWETAYGLDPKDAADGVLKTIDVNGSYTNLEMYLNSLVKDIMDKCLSGGDVVE